MAYNASQALGYATTMWDQVSQWQISANDVATGSFGTTGISIPAECNGSTLKMIHRGQHLLISLLLRVCCWRASAGWLTIRYMTDVQSFIALQYPPAYATPLDTTITDIQVEVVAYVL